jgi:hypothetical protein
MGAGSVKAIPPESAAGPHDSLDDEMAGMLSELRRCIDRRSPTAKPGKVPALPAAAAGTELAQADIDSLLG